MLRYLYPALFCLILLQHTFNVNAQSIPDISSEIKESFDIIRADPAKGKKILDKLERSSHTFPDSLQGRLYTMYGVYYGITTDYEAALRYMQKALPKLNALPLEQARCMRNMGTVYRLKGEIPTSLDYYKQALKLLNTPEGAQDQAVVYGEIGSTYRLIRDFKSATRYLISAIKKLESIPDHSEEQLMVIKQKLINNYVDLESYSFAKALLENEILPELKASKDQLNYNTSLITYGQVLYHLKIYDKAASTLKAAIEGLRPFNNEHLTAFAYAFLGKTALATKSPIEALHFFNLATPLALESGSDQATYIINQHLELLIAQRNYSYAQEIVNDPRLEKLLPTTELPIQAKYYRLAGEILLATRNNERALEAIKRAFTLQDSLVVDSTYKARIVLLDDYQSQVQRKDNELLSQKVKLQQRTLTVIITLVLLFALVGIYQWRTNRLKNKIRTQQLEIVSVQKKQLEQKLQAEEALSRLKEDIISVQRRELVASTLESANFHAKVGMLLQQAPVQEDTKVQAVLSKLFNEQEYWKNFIEKFNLVYPTFIAQLQTRYPQLTTSEIYFCTLIKLHLSYEEIAAILQIPLDAIPETMQRVSQKLELSETSDSLESVIQDIA